MKVGIDKLSTEQVEFELFPRQKLAIKSPAKETLFGGHKGGGKSTLLVARAIGLLSLADRKWRETGISQDKCLIVYFRKNLDNLRGLIAEAKGLYAKLPYGLKWSGMQEKMFRASSGAQVIFRHLDGPDDHEGWNGIEIYGLGIDQGEDIPWNQYKFLAAQVRSSDPDYRKLLWILVTANPGGRHADWVYRYFIEPHPAGGKILRSVVKVKDGEEKVYTRTFIRSELRDNPALYADGEYEANLRSLPKFMQRWYIDGDWTSSFDGYFSGILRPEVSFIDSFSIDPNWELGLSIDWGERSPACALIAARDSDGRVFFIDELYEPGVTGRIFGSKMQRWFAKQEWSTDRKWEPAEVPGVIDPSAAWEHSARGTGHAASPIPAAISSFGFRLFPAVNDRVEGWRQMSERMVVTPEMEQEQWPCSFYVFRDRCPNLMDELSRIMPDPKKPGDVDTTQRDHAVDSCRYRCLDWPLSFANANKEDEELERWLAMSRASRAGADAESMTTGYGD